MIQKGDGSKESKVEVAKKQSRHLRGTVGEELQRDSSHFSKDDVQVLKFHGVYQQDDRDVRHERRKAKEEEAYQFMVRCAIPGGNLTWEQYLNLDGLADSHANGTLRVTTRQGFQFHGVIKGQLKGTIAGINEKLVTTLSACGDVERNVMSCPAPLPDEAHATLRQVSREIARELRPKSGAYHEIWLDGEKQLSTDEEEPFYGDKYLPRKFKTGISLAEDNCIDVYTQDCGLIAIVEDGRLVGYNMAVGGGLGMTHNKPDTSARLGQRLGFIEPDHAVEATRTVASIFRDYGNREDRRHARLKYLIAEKGMDWFRDEFQRRALFPLHEWRAIPAPVYHDHLGANPQHDGKWFYGVWIENGRIKNENGTRMKDALRQIVATYQPGITLTPHQNLLLTGLDESVLAPIEQVLIDHGVTPATKLSAAKRYSMACPALPTCGLAMSESERIMPSVVEAFEAALTSLGVRDEPLTLRMTGCPNGCARPYTADIAFVGRRPDAYHIYVGGGLPGDRIADLYAADVDPKEAVNVLMPLLKSWVDQRRPGESLSDYYQRVLERDTPRQAITGKEDPTRETVELKVLH